MAKKAALKSKKKKNIKLPYGNLHVNTTFSNTVVTLTDENGNKISGGGAGTVGFKGTKQSTPYAAEITTRQMIQEARDKFGLKEIGLKLKGLGLGRDGVFKAINDLGGVDILFIKEKTPIKFGGGKGIRPKRN